MTLNDIMSTYLPLKVSPEVAVYYACSGIYYTHQKIIVHILSENMSLKLNVVQCVALPQSTRLCLLQPVWTSIQAMYMYKDAISSNI